jgi:hypothetical protein
MNANVELDSSFYNELLRLTKLLKSIGGRVWLNTKWKW